MRCCTVTFYFCWIVMMLFVSLSDPALMKTFALHRHFTNGSLAARARQRGTIHQLEHTPLSQHRRRHYEARGHPVTAHNKSYWQCMEQPPLTSPRTFCLCTSHRSCYRKLYIIHDSRRAHLSQGHDWHLPVIMGIILTAACYGRPQPRRAGVSALQGQKMGRRLWLGSSHQQSYMCQAVRRGCLASN